MQPITVSDLVDMYIGNYENGDRYAFASYPQRILKEKMGFEFPKKKGPREWFVSEFVCKCLDEGKVTADQLKLWLMENLSTKYLIRLRNHQVNSRSITYSDLIDKYDPDVLNENLKNLEENPEEIAEYIHILSDFDRRLLKYMWKHGDGQQLKELTEYIQHNKDKIKLKNVSYAEAYKNLIEDMFDQENKYHVRIYVNKKKYPNCSPEIQELVKEEVTKWLLEYWKTDGRCAHEALLTAIKNKSHMFFDINQDGSYRFKIDDLPQHCWQREAA